jgi:hemolysin-activating ACP:hemolysin acyltransferase
MKPPVPRAAASQRQARPAKPVASTSPIVSRQLQRQLAAFGVAIDMMFRRKPFSRFNFGKLCAVVRAEIRRGHYLIAFRDDQPVGYAGWAECTKEVAERWMHESYSPSYQECTGGDCAVLITFVSTDTKVTMHLIRQARLRYPNRPIYFKREYADGTGRKSTVKNVIPPRNATPDAG